VQKVFADTLTTDVAPAANFASALDTAGARVRALGQTSAAERPPDGNWFWALIEPDAGDWELIEPGAVAVVLVETPREESAPGSESYWALIERGEKAEAFMCSPEEGADDGSPFDSAQR
jgi:hypothetical protein